MIVRGKHGQAIIYNEDVEPVAISQIIALLNHSVAENTNVRIMPDVHAGAGCVIGYTACLTDKVIPNLIGVDIGCGVSAWKLGSKRRINLNFEKLDLFIRKNIPSGRNTRNEKIKYVDETSAFKEISKMSYTSFYSIVSEICKKQGQNFDYVMSSLATLGGGNHFIEIDEDDEKNLWLIVHSGSRNFGLKVAKYHQNIAEEALCGFDKFKFQKKIEEIRTNKKGKEIEVAIQKLRSQMIRKGKRTGLEFLEGSFADDYYSDMFIAQTWATFNRQLIGKIILQGFYNIYQTETIESVHNYINFIDNIIRKGAISAHKGEKVIIPLNMADGCIIGIGKGNKEWNFSAPHGAGRKMSRSKAKEDINLEDFQKIMNERKVWSSCVSKNTLDESPQAYKKTQNIIECLEPTVEIECHMKSVYNYKS